MTECRCEVCRAYEDERSAERIVLHAWADEAPPAFLRARVLVRALATPQRAPAPVDVPHALPLFAVVAVMAALVGAIRLLASWGPDGRYWPRLVAPAVLDVLGPTGVAAFLMLGMGALATLALAPALFLESQGLVRRRRTLGLHG
jgi:hypothetical protein